MAGRLPLDRPSRLRKKGALAHARSASRRHSPAPQLVVPVHGEFVHLESHAALAQECGVPHTCIPANGKMLQLAPGTPRHLHTVPSGYFVLDGKVLRKVDSRSLRQRQQMLDNGLCFVSMVIDQHDQLMADPVITSEGLAEDLSRRRRTNRRASVTEEIKALVEKTGGLSSQSEPAVLSAITKVCPSTV